VDQLAELLEWVAIAPRTYAETIEAWGSHCPRATPWEDAQIEGFVEVRAGRVTLSARGRERLRAAQPDASSGRSQVQNRGSAVIPARS
jgi:hypothetical protein